jgi:hypothetical protein
MTNRRTRRANAAKQRKHEDPEEGCCMRFVEEDGDLVLYAIINGVRIAKRYAGENWIVLEPGYTVHGSEPGGNYGTLTIEYADTAHH